MMAVHPSGFYAWCTAPERQRALEDRRLLGHIKQSWLESGAVYGYRKVSEDLRDLGEQCGINRVHRIMRAAGLRSQTGYGKRRFKRGGSPSVVAPNHLQRQFDVTEPNKVWVTDITYIRTHEGWLYLAAVLDLFSRQVIGWSMGSRMDRELALNALLMAVWRRQPKQTVMVHSDSNNVSAGYSWVSKFFVALVGQRRAGAVQRSGRPDPHSDRQHYLSFPGPVGCPATFHGEVSPRRYM